MNLWILFAILAWCSMWVWWFFHNKASFITNPLWWAILVSLVAIVFWAIILLIKWELTIYHFKENLTNYKSLYFIIFVWLFALLIDFFTLKTFSTGIEVSVWLPIIIITSIISSALLGFFIWWENLNFTKIIWITISMVGVYFLIKK